MKDYFPDLIINKIKFFLSENIIISWVIFFIILALLFLGLVRSAFGKLNLFSSEDGKTTKATSTQYGQYTAIVNEGNLKVRESSFKGFNEAIRNSKTGDVDIDKTTFER